MYEHMPLVDFIHHGCGLQSVNGLHTLTFRLYVQAEHTGVQALLTYYSTTTHLIINTECLL